MSPNLFWLNQPKICTKSERDIRREIYWHIRRRGYIQLKSWCFRFTIDKGHNRFAVVCHRCLYCHHHTTHMTCMNRHERHWETNLSYLFAFSHCQLRKLLHYTILYCTASSAKLDIDEWTYSSIYMRVNPIKNSR